MWEKYFVCVKLSILLVNLYYTVNHGKYTVGYFIASTILEFLDNYFLMKLEY